MAAEEVGSIKYSLDLDDTKFKGKAAGASSIIKGLGGQFQAAEEGSRIFTAGVAAAGIAMGAFALKSVQAFSEAQKVDAQLNQVLQSTGKISQVSQKQVQGLATAIEHYSGLSDEAIKTGQTLLLQFEGINSKTLPQASKLMTDLAVRMGKDVTGAAQTLGMALTDPELAFRKLRTVGILFSDDQQKAIKAMKESGDIAGAQQLLFKALEKNIGGAAQAYGQTLAGQVDIAKEKFDDFMEVIGAQVAGPLTKLVEGFNKWFDAMGGAEGLMTMFTQKIQELAPWISTIAGAIIGGMLPALAALIGHLILVMAPLIPFIAAGAALGFIIKALVDHFGGWGAVMARLTIVWQVLLNIFNTAIKPAFDVLWTQINTKLLPALKELWTTVGPVLGPALKQIAFLFGSVLIGAIIVLANGIAGIAIAFTFVVTSIAKGWNQIFGFFKKAWDVIGPIAKKIGDAIKAALDPTMRHSPSLVDRVTGGVGKILKEYKKIGAMSLPGLTAGAAGMGRTNNSNINIHVAKVSSMENVEAIGRELGFRTNLIPG